MPDQTTESAIVWFKNDLRLDDNPALTHAIKAKHLLCVYCVDARFSNTTLYNTKKIGRHRQAFIGESLAALRAAIDARNGRLVVRRGEPETVLADIACELGADTIWAERETAPEEVAQIARVRQALDTAVRLELAQENTLYRQANLPFDLADMPRVYTPFRKTVEDRIEIDACVGSPDALPGPSDAGQTVADDFDAIEWPANETPFTGGEAEGRTRLDHYFWQTDHIAEYKQTRNGLLGLDYSSKFSPWLANGCLSARRIAAELAHYEADRTANKSTYWLLFELRWREFYHWILAAERQQLFQREGLQGRNDRPSATDAEVLSAWQQGRTGLPFVDAGMRELAATGYLSNRARQNVASFLARDLAQDWRWGAAWFEEQLVDYDVASNWGNWATVAGVGTDKRDNGFDVLAQAERYDPKTEYVSHWVPELQRLPVEQRHRPWASEKAIFDETGYARLHMPLRK